VGDHGWVKPLANVAAPSAPPSATAAFLPPLTRWQAVERILVSPWLAAALLALGVALRVGRYASDRALWLDESYLALNLMNRSYSELLGTLDFGQGAPPAFLLAQKLVVESLGDGEHALRLLPFVSGIVALLLFYAVARRLLTPVAVPIALLLFAVAKPIVVYSAELKQYGIDVAVVLALIYIFLRVVERSRFGVREALLLAATGAGAVWLSHPAGFVLAGIGAGTAFALYARGDRRALALLPVPAAAWLVSFLAMYGLTLRNISHVEEATGVAAGGLGSPPKNIYLLFNHLDVLDWMAAGLGPAFVLAGVVTMWAVAGKRPMVVAGAGVVLATVAAGVVGKYPVGGRFVLFLLPLALLFLAEGAVRLVRALPRDLAAILAVVFALVVLGPPVKRAVTGEIVRPPDHEEIRPVLAYVAGQWQKGDTLYVTGAAQYALRYYLECSDCRDAVPPRLRAVLRVRPHRGTLQLTPALISETPDVVIGGQKRRLYADDVDGLRGRERVWALFTHRNASRKTLLEPLAHAGRELQCSDHGVAFACLYDLSPALATRALSGRVP